MGMKASIDFAALTNALERIELFAEQHVYTAVANPMILDIRSQSKLGIDGQADKFHGYNPQYAKRREKASLPTEPKDLTWTGGLLQSVELRGHMVTVDEEHMPIASGLMTDPRRSYWEDFLDTNQPACDRYGAETAQVLQHFLSESLQ